MVLPTDDYFPGTYTASDDDIRAVIDRLCGFVGIHPGRVTLGCLDDYAEDEAVAEAPGQRRATCRPTHRLPWTGHLHANAALELFKDGVGRRASFHAYRIGSLTEEMYGYAPARYAWIRGEPDPPWVRHLDTNPRTYLRQALRYLRHKENEPHSSANCRRTVLW